MFDQGLLDRIRAAVDISAVVGEYVSLKKAGTNRLKGLCPFHKEKTASFYVNTALQIFKCFGCGAGGNVTTFLMKIENIPFPEAVTRLAQRAGIQVESSDSPEERERRRLLQALETAATLYHKTLLQLPEGRRALGYLEGRGITRETIEKFRLGFSSGREIFGAGLPPALLARAGLAATGYDNSQYDRLRGRITFPIADENGRTIGFGGRGMDETVKPKYLNTPETPVYRKSQSLYAFHLAKDAIRKSGNIVLVEGYFDAIAAHMHGIANTVATLGTSLTEIQLKILKRFSGKLSIVYDEDAGGNEAALRGLDMATAAGFTVRVVRLPQDTDPDEFLAEKGAEAFGKMLEDSQDSGSRSLMDEPQAAVSLADFRLEIASRHADPSTLEGKVKIVNEMLPFLSKVPNAIERHAYIRRIAARLGIREEDVEEEVAKFKARTFRAGGPAKTPPPGKPPAPSPAEKLVIAGALNHKAAAISAILKLPEEAFEDPAAQTLVKYLRSLLEEGKSFSISSIMDEFQSDAGALDMLSSAGGAQAEASDEETCLEAVQQLERRYKRHQLKKLQKMIEQTRDPETIARLLAEKQRLASRN